MGKGAVRIGVHTSIAGGLPEALKRAHGLGCSTVQIFSHNPRGWAVGRLKDGEADAFRSLRVKLGISPVFVHASYLINIASADAALWRKSLKMLRAEMERADEVGADFVVLHPGSLKGDELRVAGTRAARALGELFEGDAWNAGLLIENTATGLSASVGDMAWLIRKSGVEDKIAGVCIDTCHAFQAGYDIRTKNGVERLSAEVENGLGTGRVKLIHLNDSKRPAGSSIDRHEQIGFGEIGINGLRRFLRHKTFTGVPIVLETPKKEETDDRDNLERTRKLIA